jgi:hypothetical protein
MTSRPLLFRSFFLGGFECSTHRLPGGKRLDLVAATSHDALAASDYRLLQRYGMRTARDGVRWHLIEATPGKYDFSSLTPMLRAARETGMQVIWDLWHYGWPDDLDIWSPAFVDRFASFARAFAQVASRESAAAPYVAPINEISFFSWAGGDGGIFNPFAKGRGNEMKAQLIRASIAAIEAMWSVNRDIRVFQIDPVIHVVANPDRPDAARAEAYRQSQFEAWDMLSGRSRPELGGKPEYLDVMGVNYYIHNQRFYDGEMLAPSHPQYRHVREMLQEVYERYRRPLFIAETGIEDEARPAWLRYMGNEVRAAMSAGVPIEGLCLYPIVNHPGWDDDRHCYNGLFDYPDETGARAAYKPLADELARQAALIEQIRAGGPAHVDIVEWDEAQLDWAAHIMKERTDEGRRD